MKDLFGKAIFDFQTQNNPQNLITETSISEADEMSVSYLFRDFEAMPNIEKTALALAFGKVLDVGAGAGSHSLYLQNQKKLEVHAIDISANAMATCLERGIINAKVCNIFDYDFDKFDTILLLMNGAGMCGKLNKLILFLTKLKSLLLPNGQILLDSSDIIYMFDEDKKGNKILPTDTDYYGEVVFNISYKNQKEVPFDWMYIDFQTLKIAAQKAGLHCEMICEGEHFDYLAKLNPI